MAAQRRPHGPHGPHRGPMPRERAKDFKGAIRNLLHYMGSYKIALLAEAIFAILSTIFSVIGPKILGNATTELFSGLMAKLSGTGAIDFSRIGGILLTLLGIYILCAAFSSIQGLLMTQITQKLCYRLRRDISEKINRMPLAYFEGHPVGDVLSRITNDVDTLGQSLNQSINQFITALCTLVGVLVMMLTISPLMALLTVLILPISALLMMIIVKHSQKYFVTQQEALGKIDGQIEETFAGHDIVKAFHQEKAEQAAFCRTNDVLYESAWKSQFLSGLMMPVMSLVSNLGYVAIAIFGAMLAARGAIEIGDIVAFVQYVKNFTQPVTQIAQVSNMLQSMAAAAERIFAFLEAEEEDQAAQNPTSAGGAVQSAENQVSNVAAGQTAAPFTPSDPASIRGAVSFDHVRFGYTPQKTVIHDFTCEIEPGQMVALVGPTGAGKTTIVKLLMRFYDVDSGDIRLDGRSVKSFDRNALRQGFGMVLQDTWLFKGTIMENIRYGRLDATDEEVVEAAKLARADKFIRGLPGGYQMEINEEANNISQGQKQLLTIARAILADNPILILDEATSSVDTRTEQLIQAAMDTLLKGRTSFVIAHRLSTIRNADLILVIRDGDIVEQGTHEELLRRNGFYAELYNAQFTEV